MDSGIQFKQILQALKRNPNLDQSNLRNLLQKLKTLKGTVDGPSGDLLYDAEFLNELEKEINEGLNQNSRQTWEPTIYEYIVFFIVLAIIIFIFGKTIPIVHC